MRSTFEIRLICSFKALGIVWLVCGIIFMFIARGPTVLQAWCIWGTAVFAIGWIVVGLPLIIFGEWTRRVPRLLIATLGGIGGALVMSSPIVFNSIVNHSASRWDFLAASSLGWEGVAFAIAASATLIYRMFLDTTIAKP
jgi:hypothetical protein